RIGALKKRLSNGRRPHCSTRSTGRTSSASRTVSGPDGAPTTRWMRLWVESGGGRGTGYRTQVSRHSLIRSGRNGWVDFLEHRIGDQRIIRLIQKWLKAGVLEDGAVTVSEVGTGQGSVMAP